MLSRTQNKKYFLSRFKSQSLYLCFLALIGAGCTATQTLEDKSDKSRTPPAQLSLTQSSFDDLPGWGGDDFIDMEQALRTSCERIMKRAPDEQFGVLAEAGTYKDWQYICAELGKKDKWAGEELRYFFQAYFTPYMAAKIEQHAKGNKPTVVNPIGLFTGYYEASLKGSWVKTDTYSTPLYQRPTDLVMVQLGNFRDDLKGVRIAGRVLDGRLEPYESRAEIVAGAWPHNDSVLLWIDNPIDAFFVQIQGSGLVQMNSGETLRIGYAGQNGHPYTAIGKTLIERGALTRENVSMQTIREWLENNPSEAEALMNENKSYVFFRIIEDGATGPIGAEGIPLTPRRSMAIDHSLISYGIPVWIDVEHPVTHLQPIRKMMIAQDTGGAIRGPVRGDFFWGNGQSAEELAGRMKSSGRYWLLLPKKSVTQEFIQTPVQEALAPIVPKTKPEIPAASPEQP